MVTEKLNIKIKNFSLFLSFLFRLLLCSAYGHNFDFKYSNNVINFDFLNSNYLGVIIFL